MKLWISKNSEVPVHEQIVTQVTIAVASGDVEVGGKLPSTGEIARRFDIHANTAGAAYQRLVEQGLLEFRAGKGYFVADREHGPKATLETVVADAVKRAKELGYDADDIVRILGGRRTTTIDSFLLVESDDGLREIILHELRPRLSAPINAITFDEFANRPASVGVQLTAMSDEKAKIDPLLADGQTCVYLLNRSAADAMKGQIRPGPNETIAVASGWNDFLTFARVMLLAAKIEPGNLIVRSTKDDGWLESVSNASTVICDVLTASRLDGIAKTRVFHIVSEDSVAELAAAVPFSS